MSNLATILMADASSLDVVNRTLEAHGQGPNSLTVALVAGDDDAATHETAPLRWVMLHMGAQDHHVVVWAGLVAGVVPENDEFGNPVAWGTGAIPTEQDVIDAWGGGKVRMISRAAFAEFEDTRPRGERPPNPLEWRVETFAQENVKVRPYDPNEV